MVNPLPGYDAWKLDSPPEPKESYCPHCNCLSDDHTTVESLITDEPWLAYSSGPINVCLDCADCNRESRASDYDDNVEADNNADYLYQRKKEEGF